VSEDLLREVLAAAIFAFLSVWAPKRIAHNFSSGNKKGITVIKFVYDTVAKVADLKHKCMIHGFEAKMQK
jgi:hypothetical protein